MWHLTPAKSAVACRHGEWLLTWPNEASCGQEQSAREARGKATTNKIIQLVTVWGRLLIEVKQWLSTRRSGRATGQAASADRLRVAHPLLLTFCHLRPGRPSSGRPQVPSLRNWTVLGQIRSARAVKWSFALLKPWDLHAPRFASTDGTCPPEPPRARECKLGTVASHSSRVIVDCTCTWTFLRGQVSGLQEKGDLNDEQEGNWSRGLGQSSRLISLGWEGMVSAWRSGRE